MKPKELIEMFPYGYARLRNQNGSIALTLETKSTVAFVFVKRIPKSNRMPPIDQKDMDYLQLEFGKANTVIDWFSDDSCRFFITSPLEESTLHYRLVLNAFFNEESFEITGNFYEKKSESHRKRVYNERYLKRLPPNALTTETDFTSERYDIVFPDDALTHCRRLGNVIAMNTFCTTESSAPKLGGENLLEDNNEIDAD